MKHFEFAEWTDFVRGLAEESAKSGDGASSGIPHPEMPAYC